MKGFELKKTALAFFRDVSAFGLLAFFVVVSFAACGKKGPPVAPDLKPLPGIENLRAEVSLNVVMLQWEFSDLDAVSAPDGFQVYRSRKRIEDADCRDCPDIFRKAADVTARVGFTRGLSRRLTWSEPIEPGHVYLYKVMAYTDHGQTGEWSNTVEVMY